MPLSTITKRIDAALAKAGRPAGDVRLIAISKVQPLDRIRAVLADLPVLCDDKVRTLGDPIAIVAADTRARAVNAQMP